MGRFKGGKAWWQPYLDNQTWGAAFLKAIGEQEKARRALSYARETLVLPAQGGQLFGLDGQGGPWSVWKEGTAQYVAVGGEGADDLLQELLAQHQENGALFGGPDDFSGGGVWTTRWVGVAPASWLYFALNDEPFHPNHSFSLSINGPARGDLHTPHTFNASVTPTTTITPLTYTWQATNQTPVTHTTGLSDAVSFTWNATGTQVVTVTATNGWFTATETQTITINPIRIYLPILLKPLI